MQTEKEKYSLKDHLFNRPKVVALATRIKKAYPSFNSSQFVSKVLKDFNQLELKQRIERITVCLEFFFPDDYSKCLAIILKSLPPACDATKTDNDYGDFIFEPFNLFIARNGCTKERLKKSLAALEQTTQRFSAEFALRFFISRFEKETLLVVKRWSKHRHYHVRRLASEGIRPNLPWGGKIKLAPKTIITVLDNLYLDKTRYVTRSVANNLNDISKVDSALVISTLKRWRNEGKQEPAELAYIEKHALRTLIKLGNENALSFLGFKNKNNWKIKKISIPTKVKIGEKFTFTCEVQLLDAGSYLIDYIFQYAAKNGNLRPKVFKVKKISISKSELITIQKNHHLKKMTTRKLFAGTHAIEIQINGKKSKKYEFKVLD